MTAPRASWKDRVDAVDPEMLRAAEWRLRMHLEKSERDVAWTEARDYLTGRVAYYKARLAGESHEEAICRTDAEPRGNPMPFMYPKAGELQRDMTSKLTSNPEAPRENPWEVRSAIGLEGVFANQDDADFYADELRGIGARGVTSKRREKLGPLPRPAGAPPMYHRPHGRPPGVPNPDANPMSFTPKGERMYQHIRKQYEAKGDPHAKEIAARTVYASAHDGATDLIKSPLKNPEETFDTDILFGMERAIWVVSYADAVEAMSKAEREACGAPVSLQGVEWCDVAPASPVSAQMAAQDLYLAYERANGSKTPGQLYELAVDADGARPTDELADTFGHYLAMMALGHGVSWFDDHAEFKLKIPGFEAHYDGGEVVWSPMIRSRLNGATR